MLIQSDNLWKILWLIIKSNSGRATTLADYVKKKKMQIVGFFFFLLMSINEIQVFPLFFFVFRSLLTVILCVTKLCNIYYVSEMRYVTNGNGIKFMQIFNKKKKKIFFFRISKWKKKKLFKTYFTSTHFTMMFNRKFLTHWLSIYNCYPFEVSINASVKWLRYMLVSSSILNSSFIFFIFFFFFFYFFRITTRISPFLFSSLSSY